MLPPCGCYRTDSTAYSYGPSPDDYLPLLDSEAHTTILSTTSNTLLKQTFSNPSPLEEIDECTYTFPLYDGVSVVGFTCKVGSKTLRGRVKEKDKAKEIFDAAVARGETAGLLAQSTEASDVFSTKLGKIPAGASIIVEITYIGELKHDDLEGTRFTIPTIVAPRYGADPYDAAPSVPQRDSSIKITVDVNLPQGQSIKEIRSPSHPIAVSLGTLSSAVNTDPALNKASATLSLGTAALEKDFVLIVQSKGTGTPKAILETHPTIPNHRALMATLVPKFSLPPSRSEIIFVADRSGSMQANIPMLKSALKVFLKSMPIGTSFNICSFGSTHKFMWPKSRTYTNKNLDESIKHISSFDANYGGTETLGAIKATIMRRLPDLPLEIILLTDGDIWSQGQAFDYVNQEVKKSAGGIRVFTLGIGNGVSHALIEGLARAGNGFSQAVQDGERLDSSVVRMLRGALSPHITDYTLEVKYEQEDDDFEVVEKVTDCMKMLDVDDEPAGSKEQTDKPQATISLFDPSINANEDSMKLPDEAMSLPNLHHPSLLQAPHKIPSLFAFSRTTVYLLMGPETIQRNPSSIVLRATSSHGPLALEIPIEVLSEPGQTIHQLAARKASQDLEESRGWVFDGEVTNGVLIKDKYPSQLDLLVQKEAVRLGETFQVANKWCSFVALSANGESGNGEPGGNEVYVSSQERPSSDSDSEAPRSTKRRAIYSATTLASFSPPPSAAKSKKDKKKSSSISPGSSQSLFGQAPKGSSALLSTSATRGGLSGSLFGSRRMASQATAMSLAAPSASPPGSSMNFASEFTSEVPSFDRETQPRGDGRSVALPTRSSPLPPSFVHFSFDKVLALIDLQNFDGSWTPDAAALPSILSFPIPQAPVGVLKTTWVTILVISFLQQKMAEEEGMWGLVVEKAMAYVLANVQDGLEEVQNAANEAVKKN